MLKRFMLKRFGRRAAQNVSAARVLRSKKDCLQLRAAGFGPLRGVGTSRIDSEVVEGG